MSIWDRIKKETRQQGSSEFPALGHYTVRSGDEVAGCEILQVLGQGSGGIVYLGKQLTLERKVAVKMLSPDLIDQDKLFHERFLREAQTSAKLTHPNIVQVHNATIEDGRYFIVMEYVDGQALDVFIEDGVPLPLDVSMEIFEGICAGLAYAHDLEIIHRDIKPANVLIGRRDAVKIMDFGLAKVQGSATLTAMGAIVGTPHYVSPEICRGDKADQRSDLYSLGATFYHVLTGNWLFPGETPITVMIKQLKEQPVSVEKIRPDVPPRLARLVMKMLCKDPPKRPQKIQEVIDELRAIRAELASGPEDAEPGIIREPETTEEHRLPKARLMCLTGALKGRRFPLSSEGRTSIGRLSENEISILHGTVSRRHCIIEAAGGEFAIKDLGSANGCMLNGEPVTGAQLSSGDLLRVGDIEFQFRALSATEDAHDLADILVEDGLLSDSTANEVLDSLTSEWHKGSVDSLGQFLIKRGVLTPEALDGALEKLNDQAIKDIPPPDHVVAEMHDEIEGTLEMQALGARVRRARGLERDAQQTDPDEGPADEADPERAEPTPDEAREEPSPKKGLSVFDGLDEMPLTGGAEERAGPVSSFFGLENEKDSAKTPQASGVRCIRCGSFVLPSEIERGTARVIDNKVLCPNCASSQW